MFIHLNDSFLGFDSHIFVGGGAIRGKISSLGVGDAPPPRSFVLGNNIYGSLNNIDSIFKDSFEKLHIKICKQILGTHRKTMNTPVLGELGRFPMKLSINIQMIKYFLRLDKLPKEKFLHKLYIENKTQQENRKDWNCRIKEILSKCGFSYIWRNQFNDVKQDKKENSINRIIFYTNERHFFTKCISIYKYKDKNKNCGKMIFLSQIKQTYAFEPYLNIGNDNHR